MNILIMGTGVCGKTTLAKHIAQAVPSGTRIATVNCRDGRPVWKSIAMLDEEAPLGATSEYHMVVWLCRTGRQLQIARDGGSDRCLGAGTTQLTLIRHHPWPPQAEQAEPFYRDLAFWMKTLIKGAKNETSRTA